MTSDDDASLERRLYVALVEQRVIDSRQAGAPAYPPVTWGEVRAELEGGVLPDCDCEPIYIDVVKEVEAPLPDVSATDVIAQELLRHDMVKMGRCSCGALVYIPGPNSSTAEPTAYHRASAVRQALRDAGFHL